MNRMTAGVFTIVLLSCLAAISTADIPDLTGNWTGPYTEYQQPNGFFEGDAGRFSLNITEQQDRIFTGFLIYSRSDGSEVHREIVGVVSSDGTELSVAEKENGYSTGKILGPDEIELVYLSDKDPVSAAVDHLFRTA